MFSCQLKFVIDLIKKWPAKKYFCRYKEHDLFSKQIQDGKPHWLQQNKLHNLWFLPSHRSFKLSKWKNNNFFILDFVIEKEHSFTRNIFHYDELKPSRNIETLEKYGESNAENCCFVTHELFQRKQGGRYFWWLHNWLYHWIWFWQFWRCILRMQSHYEI